MKTRILFALLPLFLATCTKVEVSIKKNFDFSTVKTLGVMEFNVPDTRKHRHFGQLAADTFSLEALKSDFSIIERSEIDTVVAELKLGQSGLVNASMAKEVGKVAGIDAMIIGSITAMVVGGHTIMNPGQTYVETRADGTQVVRQGPPQYVDVPAQADPSNISMTAKMILVETGEILWAASAEYRSDDTQTSIKGCVKEIVKALRKQAK